MTDDTTLLLLSQHQQLLDRLLVLQLLMAGMIVAFLFLIVGVCWLAAWSVARTVKGFTDHTGELRSEWNDTRKELITAMGMVARMTAARRAAAEEGPVGEPP